MKTLIVPDIHEQVDKLKLILDKFSYVDHVVFLGDYFDKFGVPNTAEMAQWLALNIDRDDYTFILGNHDQHYLFGIEKCCGYTHEKNVLIRSILYKQEWIRKFVLFTLVDGWLCSHAGLTADLIKPGLYDKQLYDWLFKTHKTALLNAYSGELHPWTKAGIDRGGNSAVGGITWCDWKSFKPTPGFNQIMGHTHKTMSVRTSHTENSKNYCIDTGLNHVMIIENGEEKVIEI